MAREAFSAAPPSLLLQRDEFVLHASSPITDSPNPDSNPNSPEVDFQAAILRANPSLAQRSFSMDRALKPLFVSASREAVAEQNEAEEEEKDGETQKEGMSISRTKSEILPPSSRRHRSPIPSPKLAFSASEAVAMTVASSTVSAFTSRRRRAPRNSVEAPQVAAEENTAVTHRRRSHRISTRRSKVISTENNASQEGFDHEEDEEEEEEEEDRGMGDRNKVTKKPMVSQNRTNQSNRKTLGNNLLAQPPILDAHLTQEKESFPLSAQPMPHPSQTHTFAYRTTQSSTLTSSVLLPPPPFRRQDREARMSSDGLDWLQYIGDVIMWRHFPRSALLFGTGCFCIMSASVIQDMKYSVVSTIAYVALLYLAVTFIRRTIRRSGAVPVDFSSYAYVITEAEALRLIRVLLPPINLMLIKLGDLFSGEPTVTLKVAAALWFLAQVGSLMNIWTLTRIAYLALFTVPKCYSCYSDQMHAQVRNILNWVWATWGACTHKKAVLFAVFIVAWNLSSVSTRACGAFVALVAVRAYQHVIRRELEIGSNLLNRDALIGFSTERHSGVSSAPSEMRRQRRMS